jgi:ribosomal protein S18 acetylase RimI-like enzyme
MKIDLRSLKPEDRPLFEEFLTRIPLFDESDVRLALELVDIALGQPDQKDYAFILAVDQEDHPIGYICIGPTPLTGGTFDLYWIAVDPDYAGKGIGSFLLAAAEEYIRSRQGRMLLIETSSSKAYEQTRRFYLKNDYELVETIPDFYQPGEDRVTYCKRFK